MTRMVRNSVIVSVGVFAFSLMVGPARAEGFQRVSGISGDRSISVVASFLEGESTELAALKGSFAMSAPALSVPEKFVPDMTAAGLALSTAVMVDDPAWDASNQWVMGLPQKQVVSDSAMPSKFEPAISRMRPRTGPDSFELSRKAFPMVVGPVPTNVSGIRPMGGPVVGVRPSYIRPASFK